MQYAIEHFKNINYDLVNLSIQNVPYILEQLLEKEKEQIMETFENGVYHARYFREDKEQLDGEDYYNQTYNQNK